MPVSWSRTSWRKLCWTPGSRVSFSGGMRCTSGQCGSIRPTSRPTQIFNADGSSPLGQPIKGASSTPPAHVFQHAVGIALVRRQREHLAARPSSGP